MCMHEQHTYRNTHTHMQAEADILTNRQTHGILLTAVEPDYYGHLRLTISWPE